MVRLLSVVWSMRAELELVLKLAADLPREELPALIGALAECTAVAQSRLVASPVQNQPDRLLTVKEVAERTGMSEQFIYRRAQKLPFLVKEKTGRALRFSSAGLDRYIQGRAR